jgi:hypothetical protein
MAIMKQSKHPFKHTLILIKKTGKQIPQMEYRMDCKKRTLEKRTNNVIRDIQALT